MQIEIKVGDVPQCPADVLISTANPWLHLSGGVKGAILSVVGSAIQEELHSHLPKQSLAAVSAGTVVKSEAGSLPFQCMLHAVAIGPFYDSSVDLVRHALRTSLEMAIEHGATTIASATLATGYGPLSIAGFERAVAPLANQPEFESLTLTLVVRVDDHRSELHDAISCSANCP